MGKQKRTIIPQKQATRILQRLGARSRPAAQEWLEIDELHGSFSFGEYYIFIGYGTYSPTGDGDDAERVFRAEAWFGKERVGSVRFGLDDEEVSTSENMWVLDTHQRRGLATAMMDAVELSEGLKIQSSSDTTSEAKAFWRARLATRRS